MLLDKISAHVAFAALFAALIAASPVDTSVLPRGAKSVDDCYESTFENQTSGGSPLVVDCQKIAANIANGGTWTVDLEGQHQLVQYGTCAFGVTAHYESQVRIGNSDIIDIINESISKFQWQGKVGAAGRMDCQSVSNGINGVMDWGIYHN